MGKQYKEIDGLFYDERTPEAVCKILSRFNELHRTGRNSPGYGYGMEILKQAVVGWRKTI